MKRFLELDSTYRNRIQFPDPARFGVSISCNGRTTNGGFIDPIALSAPIKAFTGLNFDRTIPAQTTDTVSVLAKPTVNPTPLSSSDTATTFVVQSLTAGALQTEDGYYNDAIISDGNFFRKIIEYEYIGASTVGLGLDLARITLDRPLSDTALVDDLALTITSSTSLDADLVLFVPNGGSTYFGYTLYNETRLESTTEFTYDKDLNLITVTNPPATWLPGNNYSLRKEKPLLAQTITVNGTTTTFDIVAGGVNYVGQYVRRKSTDYTAGDTGEIRRIISQSGDTLTVNPPFSSAILISDEIEILGVSRDNNNDISFTGTRVNHQEKVCYEIQLLNIMLPNQLLKAGNTIACYPYVYVELSNHQGTYSKNIMSNNRNSHKMTFRAVVSDNTSIDNTCFVKLDGGGMVQTIKFNPNDYLTFSVLLPDGSLYDTVLDENYSPLEPNKLVQISAMFSFKRMCK